MKFIVAIIRPERLEAVQQALNERDVYLMTVTDVRGCGRQRGYTEVYRSTEFQVWLDWLVKSGQLAQGQVRLDDLYTNEFNPYKDSPSPT